jgi:polar amino acid transport system substrate-binding protein/glutamate/aspartate transport system substrate-binding protein
LAERLAAMPKTGDGAMQIIARGRLALAVAAALVLAATGAAAGATLDHISRDKTLRIAYRDDAPPFSYKGKTAEPAGFMLDLCRAVAKNLAQQLGLPPLKIDYVKVTAADRFDAITQSKADLLCEPTTQTLSRRAQVDFSIPTFVDGAGLLIRDNGPKSLTALGGHKIGVLAGTTTEDELRASLKDAGITADVIPADTHDAGLAMLDDGKISAYFADRGILMFLAQQSNDPGKLLLADNYLTVEPYALALPHGDEDFRLAVDRALSTIYRSGQIAAIFTRTFGSDTKPSKTLQTLYLVSALPD